MRYRTLVNGKQSMLQQMEEARLHNAELVHAKFGRWVDIRKLESIMINQELEELKGIQHDFNVQSAQEVFHWRVSHSYCILWKIDLCFLIGMSVYCPAS